MAVPLAEGEAPLALSLVSLSGEEVAAVSAEPCWRREEVLKAAGLQQVTQRTRILLGAQELCGECTLAELGAPEEARLSLVACLRSSLLVVAKDGWVRLLCSETFACLQAFQAEDAFFAAFSPDHAAVLILDGRMKLWSTATGRCSLCFQASGKGAAARAAAFSPDGQEVLSTSEDGAARLWSVASGACLRAFAKNVASACFSPDGLRLLTGHEDDSRCLWCRASGDLLQSFKAGGGYLRIMPSFPCSALLLVPYKDRLELWSIEPCSLCWAVALPGAWISAIAVSPEGERLLTASWEGTAELRSMSEGSCLWSAEIHRNVSCAAFAPDGESFATASADGTAKIWSARDGSCLQTLKGHSRPVTQVAFSRDGLLLLTASRDRAARLWTLDTAECLHIFPGTRHAALSQ